MKFFREIFFGEEKTFTLRVIFFHALILSASVAFLYLFSYSTSPRYETFGDDSTIFQAVGKCWAEGLIPYVGAFENKGPILFAVDAIGYAIYPRVGIFFLQIPFMYFSLLFAWRAIELHWSRSATFALWLTMIFLRASLFYEGNRTEEYSMPFLLAAVYFFLRGLKEKNFPPIVGFVFGLGFGACVLLRTTNGLPICCLAVMATIFLLHAGEIKILLKNFLNFCAGFAIICLPFVIYFAAHGALYDMLYGTILINVKHATGFHMTREEFFAVMIPIAFARFTLLFWLIFLSVLVLVRDGKNKLAWSGLFCGAALLFMLLKSRPFYGYSELIISLVPLMFAVVAELKTSLSPELKKLWARRGISARRILCKVTSGLLMIAVAWTLWIHWTSFQRSFFDNNNFSCAVFTEFDKIIPRNERNSVVMWGESLSIGRFILETGIKPRCRFFGNIQMFFGKSDPAVIDEWISNVRGDYPKWIVYGALDKEFSGVEPNFFERNFRLQRNPRVEEILAEKYIITDETKLYGQTVRLYRYHEKREATH